MSAYVLERYEGENLETHRLLAASLDERPLRRLAESEAKCPLRWTPGECAGMVSSAEVESTQTVYCISEVEAL